MAKGKGITRYLSILWDRDAARRMQQEAEAALEKAGKAGGKEFEEAMAQGGKKAARALTTSLEREYRVRIGRARQQLAEGAIDEKAFEREGKQAAAAFDKGLAAGMRRLQQTEKITDLEAAQLAGRFKVRAGAGGGAAAAGGLFGGLAGIVTTGAVLQQANESIDAADRLAASERKLAGAAKVTGTELSVLQETSQHLQQTFKLSVPFANDLTGSMNKLAVRAGDANAAGPALAAWLDLAAANGLGAEEAMEALNTTIIGQDEGLNKLGLSNPQQIYEQWGKAAGVSAAKMTDAQKAQAILNAVTEAGSKVQGEYGKYLESNAGRAEQQAQQIEKLKQKTGEALQPLRELGGFLKEVLYANFYAVSLVLGGILGAWRKLFEFSRMPVELKLNLVRRVFGGEGSDRGPLLSDQQDRENRAATIAAIQAGTAVDALGRPYKTPAQRQAEAAAAAAAAAERKKQEEEARKKAEAEAAAAEKRRQAANQEVADLATIGKAHALNAEQMARVLELEERYQKLLHDDTASLQARADAAERLAKLAPFGLGQLPGAEVVTPDRRSPAEQMRLHKEADARFGQAVLPVEHTIRVPLSDAQRQMEQANQEFARIMGQAADYANEAAYQMASAFQDAFAQMMEDGATLGSFFEALGKGMVGAVLGALAQIAEAKAAEAFVHAIEAGAKALLYHDPAAAASIPMFLAEGAGWSALAGLAGAARGAITGGAGAIPPSTRDAGLDTAQDAARQPQPINIWLNPFDAKNPVQAELVGDAYQLHVELTGPPKWATGKAG